MNHTESHVLMRVVFLVEMFRYWCDHVFDTFTPQPLSAVRVLFSPMASGWANGLGEKICLGCMSETVRCRKFILKLFGGCRCATLWSGLDLTFDVAIVTLSLKILSGLYLRNHKV